MEELNGILSMMDLVLLWVSQPTLRREGDARAHGCIFHGRKMHGVATNVYSRKTSEKPEWCGL